MNAWTWFTKEMILELWNTNENNKLTNPDIIRYKIKDKIESIVENRWYDLLYYLWNKTVPWTNLDSELHQELSKKYPYDYAETLLDSWMQNINWLASFWWVLRNLMEELIDEGEDDEFWYKKTIFNIFWKVDDLSKIPLIDLDIFRKKFWDSKLELLIIDRPEKEKNYIIENLMKYKNQIYN